MSAAQAEEVLPAKAQDDAQINVWVNNSSLSVFVTQLALMTGREAAIEGDLDGQVSGRFDGSVVQALGAVSQQFPVLFDISEQTIAATPASEKNSVTIALGGAEIDDEMSSLLASNPLPGNEVQVLGDEIIVSGHPAFVARTAELVDRALVSGKGQPMLSEQMPAINLSESDGESKPSAVVVDTAAQAILDEAPDDISAVDRTESASVSSRPIRSVTDIDGFDTF